MTLLRKPTTKTSVNLDDLENENGTRAKSSLELPSVMTDDHAKMLANFP